MITPGAGQPSRSRFDEIAGIYEASLPRHVQDHYAAKRRVFLDRESLRPGPGERALEVGAGTGAFAARLPWAARVVRLDYSREMLRLAGDEVPRLQASAARLPFPDCSFALVYCLATLHHIVEPQAFAMTIAEMARVAGRGGRIVIWDHNPLNPYWPIIMARVPQDREPTRLRRAATFARQLEAAGARVRSIGKSGWIPDFCPAGWLPAGQQLERLLESLPLIRQFSAHSVILAVKP